METGGGVAAIFACESSADMSEVTFNLGGQVA